MTVSRSTDCDNLFHVGQRVKLSKSGLDSLRPRGSNNDKAPHIETLRGTVRGFGNGRETLRVQRDGIKSIDTYAMCFWEAL